jgi:hypothetical protein
MRRPRAPLRSPSSSPPFRDSAGERGNRATRPCFANNLPGKWMRRYRTEFAWAPLAARYAWGPLAGQSLALCLGGGRSPLAHRAHRALAELSCAHSRRASVCPLGRLDLWAWRRRGNHHAALALHQRSCLVDWAPQRRRALGVAVVRRRPIALPFRRSFVYCAAQSAG